MFASYASSPNTHSGARANMSTLAQPTPSDNYTSPSNDFTNHGHGEFDLDQAAMLQDMARNSTGGEGEVSIYAYDHGEGAISGFEGHEKELDGAGSSGAAFQDPTQLLDVYAKYNSRDARPNNGSANISDGGRDVVEYTSYNQPSTTQHDQDDIDPVTLLEALANFDTTTLNNRANTRTGSQDDQRHDQQAHHFSNDHFASLLQAAETAGQSQENENARRNTKRKSLRDHLNGEWGVSAAAKAFRAPLPSSQGQKRKLGPEPSEQPSTSTSPSFIKPATRRKKAKEVDPDQLARERAIWGPASDSDSDTPSGPPVSTSDARAAGVHSAAALFRRPTPASKKYTRPPMSKLFTSLELTPEQFLYLQAAAKTYMLDPERPERAGCVGNKARSDTDLVKLKLFGCVEAFLEDEGWGERCWGPEAGRGDHENRRLKWPEGKHKIITLVTPLMRRMVTNERQRLYANETRKSAGGTGGKKRKEGERESNVASPMSHDLDIDPKLADYHYALDPMLRSPEASVPVAATSSPLVRGLENATMKYRVTIVARESPGKLLHAATLTPLTCPVFSSLMQHVRSVLCKPLGDGGEAGGGGMHVLCGIKVLTPTGLVRVGTMEQWEEACKIVEGEAWMEGVVRVVGEVEKVVG